MELSASLLPGIYPCQHNNEKEQKTEKVYENGKR